MINFNSIDLSKRFFYEADFVFMRDTHLITAVYLIMGVVVVNFPGQSSFFNLLLSNHPVEPLASLLHVNIGVWYSCKLKKK